MKMKNKKTIIIIGAFLMLIILTGSAGYLYLINNLKSALTGCQVQTEQFLETVDFEYVDKWIVVKVKIEGSDKEYPFFFDTGSPTIISDSLLKDLTKANYKLFSSNNKKDTSNAFHNKLYILNGLSIGNVNFSDIGAMNFDNDKWEMLNCVSAYGIIGCNILKSCCFQIDYANKKIIITDNLKQLPNRDKIKWVNYRTDKQETPILPAKLNDSITIDLFFDTGSSGGITLYSPVLYKKFEVADPERVEKMTLLPTLYIRGETPEMYKSLRYMTSNVKFLSPENSNNIEIAIYDTPEKNFTGIAGNRYLKDYNITLDYKNKRIGYVFNKQQSGTEKNTFGFNYFTRHSKLFVSAVYENSEAKEMGLCVGDEIISINGTGISELPPEAFCAIFRNEYNFSSQNDSLLYLTIKQDKSIKQLKLKKFKVFDCNH
jgi:hypothetical protein